MIGLFYRLSKGYLHTEKYTLNPFYTAICSEENLLMVIVHVYWDKYTAIHAESSFKNCFVCIAHF